MNIVWAFAKVDHNVKCLFTALTSRAERHMRDFKSQELANTAWAFATVGCNDAGLFTALAAAAERRMKDFNWQELANTAWASAKVGHKNAGLFRALAAVFPFSVAWATSWCSCVPVRSFLHAFFDHFLRLDFLDFGPHFRRLWGSKFGLFWIFFLVIF